MKWLHPKFSKELERSLMDTPFWFLNWQKVRSERNNDHTILENEGIVEVNNNEFYEEMVPISILIALKQWWTYLNIWYNVHRTTISPW